MSDGEVVLVTDEHHSANMVLTPARSIHLGTVTFTSTGAIKGEKVRYTNQRVIFKVYLYSPPPNYF